MTNEISAASEGSGELELEGTGFLVELISLEPGTTALYPLR